MFMSKHVGTVTPALEAAIDAAWPAPDRQDSGPWVLRAAGGVTQRANSIWPRQGSGTPTSQFANLLREARAWYRSRRLPVIFQLTSTPDSVALSDFLDTERFTTQSETLVMTRGPWTGAADGPAVHKPVVESSGIELSRIELSGIELSGAPSNEWLRVWWSVDGRGGGDALAVARTILEGCPSVYALARDDAGRPAAVGRLAMPAGGTMGGVYSMATLPGSRRNGYASAILNALLDAGAAQGLAGYWLLVTAANQRAQALYSRAGFSEAGRYVYRQERPRRALTGC